MIKVEKRKGVFENLDLDKIHKVVAWAAEGLKNVSVSQVELKAHLQFFDGIKTEDIHNTLTKAAAELISEETPEYQYLSARLEMFHLRKRAYGRFEPPHLVDHINKLVGMGKYDKSLITDYTPEELSELNDYVDHSRDMTFSYAALQQLKGKYLVQDRASVEKTKPIFESPQYLYMLVSACLYSAHPHNNRLEMVKKYYDAISTFKISLPTPIMGGVRTPTRQFSSCVLIEAGDSLDTINAATSSVVKYVSQRAGIGINAGRIRALGSPIRGGEAFHTGCIPFYKLFQSAVKSCSQGGLRGGAATLFYPLWHLEVESLLVLKNNRGVEENRVRHLDYAVQFNKLMYSRLIKGGDITLFSPSDVPGLYDAFFEDQDKFEALYLQYEADTSIRKSTIKAIELFTLFAQERAGTGRIYLQNVDHCNTHSPFIAALAPIRQSNLCLEIALPTQPLEHVHDEKGEIALCTLSAFNLGAIDSLSELEELAELGVRALDNLLDYQDYPIKAAETSSKGRRTLGFGVINLANYFVKNGVKYSDGSANNLVHETFEAIQYYLLKASMNLAKELGACPLFHETKLSQGILPIDTYKRDVDGLHTASLKLDWETLRKDIVKYGVRNSTVSALMPSETSSQVSNATNGIEPPRGLVTVKSSKDGVFKQVVPDFEKYKDDYETVWSIKGNKGYLEIVAIMQKFVDQTISANTNYDPKNYPGGKVPAKLILNDILMGYKLGIKTFYYHNTRDHANEEMVDGQANTMIEAPVNDENDCGSACKI